MSIIYKGPNANSTSTTAATRGALYYTAFDYTILRRRPLFDARCRRRRRITINRIPRDVHYRYTPQERASR